MVSSRSELQRINVQRERAPSHRRIYPQRISIRTRRIKHGCRKGGQVIVATISSQPKSKAESLNATTRDYSGIRSRVLGSRADASGQSSQPTYARALGFHDTAHTYIQTSSIRPAHTGVLV